MFVPLLSFQFGTIRRSKANNKPSAVTGLFLDVTTFECLLTFFKRGGGVDFDSNFQQWDIFKESKLSCTLRMVNTCFRLGSQVVS